MEVALQFHSGSTESTTIDRQEVHCCNIYGCYSVTPLTVFGDARLQSHAGQPSLRIQKCCTPIFADQIF